MSLCLLLSLALAAGDPTLAVETVDGRQWWSVSADDAPLSVVLDQIARRSGRRLEGTDAIDEGALVTIELVRRPLPQVLEYLTGTAGADFELRSDSIVLSSTADASTEALMNEASAAWVRSLTRFPGHAQAPAARLAQGELAEARGDLSVARDHYETLVENYPAAEEVPEATLRSGLVLERLGQWSEASLRFRTLASLEGGAPYNVVSRLELARCSIELGDPQSGLHLVRALDANYPTTDADETATRELVRAQALIALERPMEALRAIEPLESSLSPAMRREAMRLRAQALDGVGLPADAARAWLFYGGEAGGEERVLALREAARLSLAADDELGVLFVCREAERFGLVEELGSYWHRARVRLGLEQEEPTGGDVAMRLKSAEELLERDEVRQASTLLEPIFLARGALSPQNRLRVVLAWADSIERRFDVDQALRLLAQERTSFEDARSRAAVDASAARLLEREGLFDRAIEAYEGRY